MLHPSLLILQTLITLLSPTYTCTSPSPPPLTIQQILTTHHLNTPDTTRQYPDLLILAFLTPWNPLGKQVALTQASRHHLDIAVPVTYQIHPTALSGGHDFPPHLYSTLSNHGTRIYPRLLFEHWTLSHFRQLAENPQPLLSKILHLHNNNPFEGVVLELWNSLLSLHAFHTPENKALLLSMLRHLGLSLRQHDVRTILVLPPYSSADPNHPIQPADLATLDPAFHHFIVMTYDFSRPAGPPGPMAPAAWVRKVLTYLTDECALGRKVLMGLNFYGVDFNTTARKSGVGDRHVVGEEFVRLLERESPDVVWVDDAREHAFVYRRGAEQHVVFFPTRRSIGERVRVVESVGGGGVAIWELGQGLNHFFDEF